jgi:signal transduction histidine kinase
MSDRGPLRVLLVEDYDEHIRLLEELLTSQVDLFHVTVASTLAEALERLGGAQLDVVLLDLTLPDSEGLATFQRIAQAAPDVPVVVMSGIQDVELALQTVHEGAEDYLLKGRVDNNLLTRSIQYAVERKRVHIELRHANELLERRVRERTEALQQANARLRDEVAERRKAEEAVLESNNQLAAALARLKTTQEEVIQRERMHALGRMANGIAHDFNNALAPILGFSELLLMKPETLQDARRARGYIEMIHNSAKESAVIVSRLREFYRYRDEGEVFMPVVINDLVLQVISLTQPRWKDQALAEGVMIDMRTEMSNVPTVPANEGELREVLANLIFNAIDAIPVRGTITIRTEVQGRWLVITVSDDGIGMTEEVRARCLEPFYSTKKNEGTGLGLGSVYGIVRRHEGEIDIQSEPGRGTAISISLPLERKGRAPDAPRPARPAQESMRILVVEDEPLVREVLSVYLQEDQHDIVVAVNGREGLEKFGSEGPFDLVMTDRAMPEMNGDQLAAQVKKLNPGQPIILLTGFGDLMAGAGEQPEGVDLVVSKPFTLATLRSAMSKVTGR